MGNENERSGTSATSRERTSTPVDPFTKERATARFSGCSNLAQSYEVLSKLGEGTFGQVFKAVDKRSVQKCGGATGRIVALKKIIVHNEKEGFPITALREIRILKSLRHDNVIPVIDMSITRGKRSEKLRGDIYMVTPYMEHDLAGLLGNPKISDFTIPQIKCYMKQLLLGIDYIHQQGYLHRDIKAANLLIDNYGILKIADFGLAKQYSEAKPTKQTAGPPGRKYTGMVVTRWYRAPELILGEKCYTTAVDMWGVGCVFGEMFNRKPIFQGSSDIDQGYLIFMNVGAPTNESMPGWNNLPNASSFNLSACNKPVLKSAVPKLSDDAFAFLKTFLTLNPLTRCTALGALEDIYFRNDPEIARPEDLPQFEDSHELDSRNFQQQQ
ncbi:Pkinase-domain-containing protein, partial [Nadsonia fulvescens var. elongata DSM 6958]